MTNQAKYDEKLKRINDAIAMKEPDRVPCIPFVQTYGITFNGTTMAQAMYDQTVAQQSVEEYLEKYDPDCSYGVSAYFCGMGPAFDDLGLQFFQWAGQDGSICDDYSIHQYHEKAYLEEDEYPALLGDATGWVLGNYLPRNYKLFEPLAGLHLNFNMLGYGSIPGMMQFADPRIADTFAKLGEIARTKLIPVYQSWAEFDKRMVEKGFPLLFNATTTVAFDTLSDCLRGTLDTMMDIVEQPENVHAAIETFYPSTLFGAIAQAKTSPGRLVFIPLHKGLEGFLSNDQYREFYWPTMLRLVEDLNKFGYTPYLYTEGKYDARLEIIKELPAGSCVVHFENCDMAEAKRLVGDHCCISGGFNDQLLTRSTPDKVADEVKRLLDICAPGGGYMFDVNCTMDYGIKHENIEAMFETVKEYGRY